MKLCVNMCAKYKKGDNEDNNQVFKQIEICHEELLR